MTTTPPVAESEQLTVEQSMRLPEGKTCASCGHFRRCQGLFQCPPDSTVCDFAPSLFRQRGQEQQ